MADETSMSWWSRKKKEEHESIPEPGPEEYGTQAMLMDYMHITDEKMKNLSRLALKNDDEVSELWNEIDRLKAKIRRVNSILGLPYFKFQETNVSLLARIELLERQAGL